VPSPASGSIGPVGVVVGDTGELPVAVPLGDAELVVADAEGDMLLDGDECVGVGDCRALVVGLGERVALRVSGAVPRLVPVE
jgi:hypothetical protein